MTDRTGHRATSTAPPGLRSLRNGARRALAGAGTTAAYVLLVPGRPGGMASVVIAGAVVIVTASAHRWAPAILRSRANLLWQGLAMLAYVAGMGALLWLDGGIGSPMSAVAVFSLLFFAALSPSGAFTFALVTSGIAYWTVALLGPPAPPGTAVIFSLGAGGVAVLSHRHARAIGDLRSRLAEISRTDPLTGCLDRRAFDRRLEAELAVARRAGGRVHLILTDLDRFKDVNDRHGHRAGDGVLAWTARNLRAAVRPQDAVGRLGGDEFGIIAVSPGAADVAARVRATLARTAPGSTGTATFPDDGTTADELHRAADGRLYEDKAWRAGSAPPPETVAAAAGADAPSVRRVSPHERRRRTVTDLGQMAAACHLIGLLYVVAFAAGRPNRAAMGLLLAGGALCGVLTVLLARRIIRARRPGTIMMLLAVPEFGAATAATVLDGGVTSPLALGLLAPLNLVALGSPLRLAAPVVGAVLATYVTIGLTVGAAGHWYVGVYALACLLLSAHCAALGRRAAGQRRELTRLSRIDGLTDCLNRRGFEERFEAVLARPGGAGRQAALVLLDLDGFKDLNDTRGHAAGDEMLRWVGTTLRAGVQQQDVVGRLGGDEFVVLLSRPGDPDIGATARRTAAALVAQIAERIGVSAGVAVLGRDAGDFDGLYAHADAELYTVKADGTRRTPGLPRVPRQGTGRTAYAGPAGI